MGRIIFGTALAGWAAIAWIAWHQANDRIGICGIVDQPCQLRATAARDLIQTIGLGGGLLIILAALCVAALMGQSTHQLTIFRTLRRPRKGLQAPTNRAQSRELR